MLHLILFILLLGQTTSVKGNEHLLLDMEPTQMSLKKYEYSADCEETVKDLQKQINSLNENLNITLDENKELLIQNTAHHIRFHEIGKALEVWTTINTFTLTEVVQFFVLNTMDNSDDMPIIFEFLYTLRGTPEFNQEFDAITKIFADNAIDITGPEVFLAAVFYDSIEDESRYLHYRNETINIWSCFINSNDQCKLKRIYDLSVNYTRALQRMKIIEPIIFNVYSGENNIESTTGLIKICKFIDNSLSKNVFYEGYEAIINKMIRVSSFDNINSIKLAIKVKNSEADLGYRFPPSIRELVFDGKNCTINHFLYNGNLYGLSNDDHFKEKKRRQFISRPNLDFEHFWKMEIRNDGGQYDIPHFHIYNNVHEEWMYTNEGKLESINATTRYLVTSNSDLTELSEYHNWNFIPVENGQFLQIKNKKLNEIAYSTGKAYGASSFLVYTNINHPNYAESFWRIKCGY